MEFGEEVRRERPWGLPLIVSAARLIERPSFNRIFTRAGSIAVASIAGSEMTEVRAVSAAAGSVDLRPLVGAQIDPPVGEGARETIGSAELRVHYRPRWGW